MPQMYPSYWFIIYINVMITLMMFIIMTYFFYKIYYTSNKNKKINFKEKKINLMW